MQRLGFTFLKRVEETPFDLVYYTLPREAFSPGAAYYRVHT